MAVEQTLEKVSVSIKLNNGTSATGLVKTVSVNLGSLNISQWNSTNKAASEEKALNIVNALTQCLSHTLYKVQETMTSELSVA